MQAHVRKRQPVRSWVYPSDGKSKGMPNPEVFGPDTLKVFLAIFPKAFTFKVGGGERGRAGEGKDPEER